MKNLPVYFESLNIINDEQLTSKHLFSVLIRLLQNKSVGLQVLLCGCCGYASSSLERRYGTTGKPGSCHQPN